MTRNKVSLGQVLSDDMTNPFWQSILSNPNYARFEQETNHIIEQSRKHRKPYVEIGEDDLK
jgi:hypothetical protein